MSSEIGTTLHLSLFGQSHSEAIGCVLDGVPAGEQFDLDAVQSFLRRRAPGQDAFSTARQETDSPEILSGLLNGVSTGAPIAMLIRNRDARSKDYARLLATPRPSHADYPAFMKYGSAHDIRGGGHFSGRLTAPLCFAGALCLQMLARRGVVVGAHIHSIGGIQDESFSPIELSVDSLKTLSQKPFPVLDDKRGEQMRAAISHAKEEGDSVGGVAECCIVGVPAGLGNPIFGGMESRLAQALFGIPAVKGVEFGSGFAGSSWRGSVNNDPYYFEGETVKTRTNHSGGLLGGLSTGMPILFRAAFKPTPSIAREQDTVDLETGENTRLRIEGRHDPCIVPRAIPCVEAVAAFVLMDMLLGTR